MKESQAKIAEFMHAAQQDVLTTPTMPDEKTRILRAKLMLEECIETIHGLGITLELTTGALSQCTIGCAQDVDMIVDLPNSLTEVADGIGDQLVVVLGTACACGLDAEGIFNEVHRSNMTKFLPGGYLDEYGKWIKSPHYSPANLTPFI